MWIEWNKNNCIKKLKYQEGLWAWCCYICWWADSSLESCWYQLHPHYIEKGCNQHNNDHRRAAVTSVVMKSFEWLSTEWKVQFEYNYFNSLDFKAFRKPLSLCTIVIYDLRSAFNTTNTYTLLNNMKVDPYIIRWLFGYFH